MGVGAGDRVFAQGKGNKGKGNPSADVPLCVHFHDGSITGDGRGPYCASERRTTVEFQIDNGSNDLIMNLGTSAQSRAYHIDLSIPEPDTTEPPPAECPVALEDIFFPQNGFFFNIDQVASVPITDPLR